MQLSSKLLKIEYLFFYRSVEIEQPVFLPTSSVLSQDKPLWVVYQDIYESNKLFMRGKNILLYFLEIKK